MAYAWPVRQKPKNSNMPAAHCELFHLRSIPVHSSVLSFAFSRSPSHSRCHICSFHYARIFEFGIDLKNLHSSEFAFTERIAQFWLKYQPPVVDSLSLACMPKKKQGKFVIPLHQFCHRTKIQDSLQRQRQKSDRDMIERYQLVRFSSFMPDRDPKTLGRGSSTCKAGHVYGASDSSSQQNSW